MSENRYVVYNNLKIIEDTKTEKHYDYEDVGLDMALFKIIKDLENENEQLRQQKRRDAISIQTMMKNLEKMETENEQLRQRIDFYEKEENENIYVPSKKPFRKVG